MPVKQLVKDRDKKFRLLFEDHPQPMWVFDARSKRILEANAAASALYGYSADEFRRMTLEDVQGAEDAERFAEVLNNPALTAASAWQHRTKGGRTIDVEIAVHEIDHGRHRARLAVIMDITGRRQLEDQLRQAQKMEVVGRLAGGVAHDFNNLLTIISGYSQMILGHLGPNDANRHSAEQIMKAADRAAALTKQLLAFSRRQVLQPRVLDLNKLVSSLGTMLRRLIGEDVDLRLALGSDLGRVSADPGQMEQVLMNLAVNARDAMPRGGILTIETGNVQLDESYAGSQIAVQPGPYVMLAVMDNGLGMDEAIKARVFEPFFTTKGAGLGTGLGLSTVFGIVKQSGGSLEVFSEPGRGTTVKVYLPRIDQPVAAESEVGSRKVVRGSETILLVEDDEEVRALVRQTLEREGYRLLDSAGPVEARHTAASHRGPIQLLITDVVMPKSSGRELADELTRLRPQMKVLYMSGYGDAAMLNSGVLEKEVSFLQKPFAAPALAEKVREVLEGTSGRMIRTGE